jgi:hypothetical protein
MSGPQRGYGGAPSGRPWGSAAGSPQDPLPYQGAWPHPGGEQQAAGPAGARVPPGAAIPFRAIRWDLARILAVAVIGLGILNFIWGFLPELSVPRAASTQGSLSVFGIGPAYVPILLLTAGLLAMTAFLPGEERSRFAVAAVSAGGAIGAIVSLGTQDAVSGFGQVNKGMGAILLVIFGLVQAVVALTAFVIGSGFVATPRSVGDVAGYGGTSAAVTQAGSGQFIPAPGQPYPGGGSPPSVAGPWPGGVTGRPYGDGGEQWGRAGVTADQGEPARSSVAPSADARSADTDPQGLPVIDPTGFGPVPIDPTAPSTAGGEPAVDRSGADSRRAERGGHPPPDAPTGPEASRND